MCEYNPSLTMTICCARARFLSFFLCLCSMPHFAYCILNVQRTLVSEKRYLYAGTRFSSWSQLMRFNLQTVCTRSLNICRTNYTLPFSKLQTGATGATGETRARNYLSGATYHQICLCNNQVLLYCNTNEDRLMFMPQRDILKTIGTLHMCSLNY